MVSFEIDVWETGIGTRQRYYERICGCIWLNIFNLKSIRKISTTLNLIE